MNVEKIEELREQALALAVALEALCLEAKAEGAGERVRKRIEQSLAREDAEVPQEFTQEKIPEEEPGGAQEEPQEEPQEEQGRYKRNIPPLQGYIPLRDASAKLKISSGTFRGWHWYGHIQMAKHPGLKYNYVKESDVAFIIQAIETKPDYYTRAGWVANRLRARTEERKKGEGK